jgi:hypothetical protein
MLHLVIILMLIGVGLYLLNRFVPMADPIKTIINVVVIVCCVLIVLQAFGLFDNDVAIPRVLGRH